ncbi:MAG: hypothetical protein R3D63_16620 [Paracoccaceae bacterium]
MRRPEDARGRRRLDRARLMRQIDLLRSKAPWLSGVLRVLEGRRALALRLPVALMLILGGVFSFLPVLGIWMLPLGLLLLAVDLPMLRRPVAAAIIRVRRWWELRRRRRR